jgi:6-phosphogluconolactonase/glucosamine-6-phosphate isomerase/deaminase
MELQWVDDEAALAEAAAAQAAALLAARPQAAVALATGRTPRGLYRRLVQRHEAGSLTAEGAQLLQSRRVRRPAAPRSYSA